MKKILQRILTKPIRALANKYASRPREALVHQALTILYEKIQAEPGKKGEKLTINNNSKIIILSDHHKGGKDRSNLFFHSEKSYLTALDFYAANDFFYISLGDSEELWAFTLDEVKKNNSSAFSKEKLFVQRKNFIKIFGNHDLYWDNDPLAGLQLESIYGEKVKAYEGAILNYVSPAGVINIFLTHGHQGDLQSDGNWFSKWFVSKIWAPTQIFLDLNINTPAVDDSLKTLHNKLMYEWSAMQNGLLLITGHTHQPVFESLTQLERLYRQLHNTPKENVEVLEMLQKQVGNRLKKGDSLPDFTAYKPTYFNSGCCCFNDGDISGIEISEGIIRLIKWEYEAEGLPARKVLQEASLAELGHKVHKHEI